MYHFGHNTPDNDEEVLCKQNQMRISNNEHVCVVVMNKPKHNISIIFSSLRHRWTYTALIRTSRMSKVYQTYFMPIDKPKKAYGFYCCLI